MWLTPLATNSPFVILGACLIEAMLGYPEPLHRRIPHPVTWLGNLIGLLEHHFNRADWPDKTRRIAGILSVFIVTSVAGGAGLLLDRILAGSIWGLAIAAFVGAFGLATRNLYDHISAIADPLSQRDLPAARQAVGRIVGRDTATMDESDIAVAATESLAESFNDGVIAPLFWFLIGGLAGLFIYKAVNTADSMIGHREERWKAFGWAAARTDDVMNFIPARLAGCLIIAAAAGSGWKTMLRDASKHASPTSGWPEAAMAGALGCCLGGLVYYDGVMADRPHLGKGSKPDAETLGQSLRLYVRACLLALAILTAGAVYVS